MPLTPHVSSSESLVDANLRYALAGANAGWLKASLAHAQRTDVMAMALDAAALTSELFRRASAQLERTIRERESETG